MPFGKADQPKRRHRPRPSEVAAAQVDPDKAEEEREDKMNNQMIPKVLSVVGTFAMLGILLAAAPYSYGSQRVHYGSGHIKSALKLVVQEKSERGEVDPKVLIDFTNIIRPVGSGNSPAMNRVSQACGASRAKSLTEVTPDKVHRAFAKATKYLTCAMATERTRFCAPAERAQLVEQLMDYKEKRQNVLAFEKYRDKAIIAHKMFADSQRLAGASPPPPHGLPLTVMNPEIDPALLAQVEFLVKSGYLSPADFGYYGMYIPTEYHGSLTVGAETFARCG